MRCQVRPGFWVGGRGLSPGSIVTWRGFGTLPPWGPPSKYSPGRGGFSPGLNVFDLLIKHTRCWCCLFGQRFCCRNTLKLKVLGIMLSSQTTILAIKKPYGLWVLRCLAGQQYN